MEGSIPFGEDSRRDLVKLKDSQNCIGQHSTVVMPHIQKGHFLIPHLQMYKKNFTFDFALLLNQMVQNYRATNRFLIFTLMIIDHFPRERVGRGKKAKGERKSK